MYRTKKKKIKWLTKTGAGLLVVISYREGHGWYVDQINGLDQSHIVYHETAEEALRILEIALGENHDI
ncbi:MAG: hypothetical protein MJ139_05780 [Limosilactobacillus sp.]|nr:hypothetical protein [Limosilactobacillus sp.]